MIPIKREPKDVILAHVIEKCYFCPNTTRMWHEKTNNPVCEDCSKKHRVSELPNRFKGEKEPKVKGVVLDEDNKLIAEFMGGKEVDWFSERVIIMPFSENMNRSNYLKLANSYILNREIKYHSSWQWLMDVVDKIEELGFTIKHESRKDKTQWCWIWEDENENPIVAEYSLRKRVVFYKSVVEFIKWHNENK